MNTTSKIKTFLTGMVLGLLAYLIYLNFLTADETTATAVGWIYFAPQYFIFWAVPQLNLSETVGLVSCYSVITLLYGYIALSIRLWPRTAIWTFLITVLLYLMIVHWAAYLMNFKSLAILMKFPLWPAYLLDLSDDGRHGNLVENIIESISVAFWYAALICGVRTIFIVLGRPTGNSQATKPSHHDGLVAGQCVAQDYVEVAKWSPKAEDQGEAKSQYNLGCCYAGGQGVIQDQFESAKWYQKAAEQNHLEAQFCLAEKYFEGLGVQQDYVTAIMWYTKAGTGGHVKAQYKLGCVHAIGYKAVNQKEVSSNYGFMEAMKRGWRESGAESSFKRALNIKDSSLMVAYFDLIAAYKWMSLASLRLYEDSPQLTEFLTTLMTEAQITEGKRLARVILDS